MKPIIDPSVKLWLHSHPHLLNVQFSSVQSLSRVWLFATPWITARRASLSITNSQSLLKLMSIVSVMPSSHLILCRPLLLPPIPPSIRVFSNESTLRVRWPKYWSFSFSISPSNEHPGLISFRMDWLDLPAVQGTFNSLLHHHSSKASILRCSAFFTVQLSHPYMTTGKTIALTRRTFVGKVMSLLFNMLSRLVLTFFPRNKCVLISWLKSPLKVDNGKHLTEDIIKILWDNVCKSMKLVCRPFTDHQEIITFLYLPGLPALTTPNHLMKIQLPNYPQMLTLPKPT